MKRRDFLKVLGATGAGAATAGCSTGQVERLIPYVVPADEIVPGLPTYYSSTCRECPAGCGIQVETHEGRATKVEGTIDHPISHGNLCARGQASVQGLYHPDRLKGPFSRETGVRETNLPWRTAQRLLTDQINDLRSAGQANRIVFLTRAYGGTMDRLADDWVSAIGARRVVYDTWRDQPRSADFANADVLISFGADFLETWGSPVDFAWQFTEHHAYENGRRGKFVWVGPHRPLTGLNADVWLAPTPGTEHILALALAGQVDVAAAARETGLDQGQIADLAQEFSGGNGVALGPGAAISGRNAPALRGAIQQLNGGRGGASAPPPQAGDDVLTLVQWMNDGEVDLLLIDAPDPVYTLPASVGFTEAMGKVKSRVSFSTFPDDTTALCTLVLPNHHFLEAWDDYVPRDGLYEIVQPAMRPVFNTKQVGDVLLAVARDLGVGDLSGITAATYYDYLRANWTDRADGITGWREAVKRGGVFPEGGGAAASTAPISTPSAAISAAAVEFEGDGDLHLLVYPSTRYYDGRTANRPWLLELPDPVTKVSWESWIELHPTTAKTLGVKQGEQVEVTSPYGSVRTFVYIYPGVRPDTAAIQTGLGHVALGRWTEGKGVNPNALLGPMLDRPYGVKVSIRSTGEHIGLRQTLFEPGERVQQDREVAQAVSVATLASLEQSGAAVLPGEEEEVNELRRYGGFGPITVHSDPEEFPPPESRIGQYIEGATRWGMVIDLAKCTGCSACVTACYAENNIPVVGVDEVRKGRELSWLRIERYFAPGKDEERAYADDATDDVRFLPMLCQQCGNAPCEPVCPVYAAYHTPDGLNGQVYNRCVGTRYCANNCPYKVRVFNWWTYEFVEPLNWQLNPDVVVREKGVMEKCTFCVQRIRGAEHQAAQANRPVRDGEIVPACVQTCPTEAFIFGDFADPSSKVSQAARSARSYRALEELNTQPAIVYLKKITLAEPEQGGHHAAGEAAGAEAH